jgi:steroid delta-isomerase-like uncharacterized protein
MSIEQNKAIVRRIYDQVINQEQAAVIDETFAADVVVHDPFMGVVSGRDAFKQLLGMFDTAFPGHRVEVHTLIAEGDWVSVIHTHTALHTGPFMNLPPTGREVIVTGVEVFRLVDDRIVEFWRHDDDAGLLRQLGALPM